MLNARNVNLLKLTAWMRAVVLALAVCAAWPAHAQLQIEITHGVNNPIAIAIVPFARAVPADGGLDVAGVVDHDLAGSGRFKPLARAQMKTTPTRAQDVVVADWHADGSDYMVVGRVSALPDGQVAVDYEILNLLTGQTMGSGRFTGPPASLRNAAHRVSDAVYEKIIGVRGAFATRIAYVAMDGTPPNQRYQLFIADADGENQRPVLESRFPLMSPAWSADGQWIAYVSFEGRHSSVYVQRVRTGERSRVSARAGINGAPSFSPDGKKLALTLGGTGGNPDIYVLDLQSQALQRITDDPAIDTEAVWSPDGQSLYFTSDRAGGPQIYKVGLKPGEKARRITFGSTYNARPRLSPDGKQLAMVTLDSGNYRIAVQDLASGSVTVLSNGRQDESPSFAPNGALLIYSGSDKGPSTLNTVSIDGQVQQRLNSGQGQQVREPVWGPFTQ